MVSVYLFIADECTFYAIGDLELVVRLVIFQLPRESVDQSETLIHISFLNTSITAVEELPVCNILALILCHCAHPSRRGSLVLLVVHNE